MRPRDPVVSDARSLGAAIAAARSPMELADLLTAAMLETVGGRRAHCTFHDADSDRLWRIEATDVAWRTAAGWVGVAVRDRRSIVVARASASREFVRGLDDPAARADTALLVQPFASPSGVVEAVVVVARDAADDPWSDADRREAGALALACAPALATCLIRFGDTEATEPGYDERASDTRGITPGAPLQLVPRGLSVVWGVVVALISVAALAAPWVPIHRVGEGPSVVREPMRAELYATTDGTIAAIHVRPGERVLAGAALVTLDDSVARAEQRRLRDSWAEELRARLADPRDSRSAAALAQLRTELATVHDHLERTVIRAPQASHVGDVRVAVGQRLVAGERVLGIVEGDAPPELLAFLPAAEVDRVGVGQSLHLTLAGHPRDRLDLVVSAVDREVIGPSEARRLVGDRMSDGVAIEGPVVVVRARLPVGGVELGDEWIEWQDGMLGQARVRVATQSALELLLPSGGTR